MDSTEFRTRVPNAAFAFRGYNVTNLGRSRELLLHARYGPTVEDCLREAGEVCSRTVGRRVDLLDRVRRNEETTLATYDEAVALVVAMEQAQIRLLKECFEIDFGDARLAFGYSLGEAGALVASGAVELADMLRTPLALARDCVELADGVTLGILFSRGPELPMELVLRLLRDINGEGRGIVGLSAILSPNSVLLLGQGDTLDRFRERMHDVLPKQTYLRKNEHQWPPLHTPIVWLRNIPSRAALMMLTVSGGIAVPRPPVVSLVTGEKYDEANARDFLYRWTDHPQLLWDVVYQTLVQGIETIVHVGPDPNIIVATYKRLADNVESQMRASFGLRALSAVARPWLGALLPQQAALLRAPRLCHVVLEDWLLEQDAK